MKMFSNFRLSVRRINSLSLLAKTAPSSYTLGILTLFLGPSLLFNITSVDHRPQAAILHHIYTTAPKTFMDPMENINNSVLPFIVSWGHKFLGNSISSNSYRYLTNWTISPKSDLGRGLSHNSSLHSPSQVWHSRAFPCNKVGNKKLVGSNIA